MSRQRKEQDNEYRLMVRAAQLYYNVDPEQRLEQSAIAERLGITQAKVSRLLKHAYKSGVIEVNIRVSQEYDLEDKLINRFNLKDAVVVIADEDVNLKREIGKGAAQYFDRTVREGMRVGISGGQTLYHMIEFLPRKKRQIEIYPVFAGGRSALVGFIDPNILVTLLWEKSENASSAYGLCVPPYETDVEKEKEFFLNRPALRRVYERMQSLDIGFTGIGSVTPNSLLVRFAEQVGSSLEHLIEKGAVGDISHVVYNKNGEEVESLIGKANIGVQIENLKEMASDASKQLVAVAGGKDKIQSIYIALKYRLADTIITDNNTADALLTM